MKKQMQLQKLLVCFGDDFLSFFLLMEDVFLRDGATLEPPTTTTTPVRECVPRVCEVHGFCFVCCGSGS